MGLRENPPGLIQTGNIAQKLIKSLGIKGKVASPRLGDQVHPVVLVEDLTHSSGWYNPVERLGAGGVHAFTPALGQFSSVQLFNPAGSGMIMIVDLITICTDNAGSSYRINQSSTALTTLVALGANWRDAFHLTGAPIAEMRTQSVVAPGGGSIVHAGRVGGSIGPNQVPLGGIYGPGQGVKVDTSTVDATLSVGFLWRERFVEEQV